MKIKIISKKYNPLLKRNEIIFQVEHEQTRGTPPRLEVKKALAETLKTDPNLVFVKKMETKTGTMTALGNANAYETLEQARLVEPDYIIKRNQPPEKPKEEEGKKEEA
ncbi:MAG: 30S ribosomal protein S24e [Candidatus Bathyarchaeia archaeon]